MTLFILVENLWHPWPKYQYQVDKIIPCCFYAISRHYWGEYVEAYPYCTMDVDGPGPWWSLPFLLGQVLEIFRQKEINYHIGWSPIMLRLSFVVRTKHFSGQTLGIYCWGKRLFGIDTCTIVYRLFLSMPKCH